MLPPDAMMLPPFSLRRRCLARFGAYAAMFSPLPLASLFFRAAFRLTPDDARCRRFRHAMPPFFAAATPLPPRLFRCRRRRLYAS
jgi:hypothetical protein